MIRCTKNLQNPFREGFQLMPALFAGILPLVSSLAIAGDYYTDTCTDTYKEENLINQKYAKNTFTGRYSDTYNEENLINQKYAKNTFTGRYSDTYNEENLINQKYAKNTFTLKNEPILVKSERKAQYAISRIHEGL